ncbi:MAG: hypothetical protein MAG451_00448 [Anaerolineales bacterium]|nr:hypothetical protein [Anaerolineales bacterium]
MAPSIHRRSPGQDVHTRRAHELCYEYVHRPLPQLARCVNLHDVALAHHGHAIGQCDSFLLIVGDVDRRGVEFIHQPAELCAGPPSRVGVEVATAGSWGRPPERVRGPLAVARRLCELSRACQQLFLINAQPVGRRLHPGIDVDLLPDAQRESDVFAAVEVRVESV